MECKSSSPSSEACAQGELIDTLWNVNEEEALALVRSVEELIDTLWNVNFFNDFFNFFESLELIDTLWNVNRYTLRMPKEYLQN